MSMDDSKYIATAPYRLKNKFIVDDVTNAYTHDLFCGVYKSPFF